MCQNLFSVTLTQLITYQFLIAVHCCHKKLQQNVTTNLENILIDPRRPLSSFLTFPIAFSNAHILGF